VDPEVSPVDGVEHVDRVMVFVSRVTAPLRAKRRPSTVAPSVAVMLVIARMFPTNCVPVPSVAELPICQKTLHGCAPLIKATRLALIVVKVLAALNTNNAEASFSPSRVSVPVRRRSPALVT
jgi:hypothetical protein